MPRMRLPRLRPALLFLMYGALSVVFCWPLFEHPYGLGVHDWDQHLFYYGAVLKNIVEYGQAPFWNPWYCGGDVLWQNPQVGLLSPVYPLAAVVPLQLAMKVNIVLHYWVGFVGMHVLLTRVMRLAFLPAVVFLATLVTASGAPVIHLAVGHSVFLPGFYMPALLFFLFGAFKTGAVKDALKAAAILALMVFNGGVHILPLTFASVGVFALLTAVLQRQWRPIVLVVAFTAAGLAYAAPKLLPVSLYVTGDRFWDTRNPTEHPDRMTLEMVARTYVNPDQDLRLTLDQQRHGWHEYGNYIGWFSAILLVAGLAWALWGRGVPDARLGRALALTAVFLFVVSLGEFSAWAPASVFTHLPLFSSFRIPSRYTIVCLLFATLALASVLRGVAFESRSRTMQGLVTLVCLAASAHLIAVNRAQLRGVFSVEPFDTAFHWMAGPREVTTDSESSVYTRNSPMLRSLMNDRLFFYCYEPLQLFRTAVAEPERALHRRQIPPRRTRRSHQTASTSPCSGERSPRGCYLNYNWGPGWTSTAGPIDTHVAGGHVVRWSSSPGQTGKFHVLVRAAGPLGRDRPLRRVRAALAARLAAARLGRLRGGRTCPRTSGTSRRRRRPSTAPRSSACETIRAPPSSRPRPPPTARPASRAATRPRAPNRR